MYLRTPHHTNQLLAMQHSATHRWLRYVCVCVCSKIIIDMMNPIPQHRPAVQALLSYPKIHSIKQHRKATRPEVCVDVVASCPKSLSLCLSLSLANSRTVVVCCFSMPILTSMIKCPLAYRASVACTKKNRAMNLLKTMTMVCLSATHQPFCCVAQPLDPALTAAFCQSFCIVEFLRPSSPIAKQRPTTRRSLF
jgi:hypothetical protein